MASILARFQSNLDTPRLRSFFLCVIKYLSTASYNVATTAELAAILNLLFVMGNRPLVLSLLPIVASKRARYI
jgi:hypothetical protein